ncbi:MAG: hypothetical protein AB7D35_13480 [Bacteroidales bacterium]
MYCLSQNELKPRQKKPRESISTIAPFDLPGGRQAGSLRQAQGIAGHRRVSQGIAMTNSRGSCV